MFLLTADIINQIALTAETERSGPGDEVYTWQLLLINNIQHLSSYMAIPLLKTINPLSPSFLLHNNNSMLLHRLRPLHSSSLFCRLLYSQQHQKPTKLKHTCYYYHYPFRPLKLLSMAASSSSSSSHSQKHTNRLASEQSPYLLQHAHNPVTASLLYFSIIIIPFILVQLFLSFSFNNNSDRLKYNFDSNTRR